MPLSGLVDLSAPARHDRTCLQHPVAIAGLPRADFEVNMKLFHVFHPLHHQ
jgi:hypothetical protein